MTSPVLIFGGSFDPPTNAHRVLPMRAASAVGSQRVIYIPAAISPHKLETPPLDPAHRLAMLELAIDGNQGAEISRIELDRAGPSYMIDTVKALRDEIDDASPLRLLIGDDQAVSFHRWKDWDPIIGLAEPLVLPRLYATPEAFAEALRGEGIWTDEDISCWLGWRLDLPIMDVEATVIRNRIQSGQAIDDLLPGSVQSYIQDNGLYRATT
ncbi:MAG: nicotinate (nicotinamide) nucleotide adenylyltransferase [Phycisphaerales bacterium]|nr:nicotinate (nicotinamide) nucleotide adenylyltransferase [Phycisphaerales bacterium]